MRKSNLTIDELLLKINRLETENKKLRIRPSMNSEDANIMAFMQTKSLMAEATLDATDIESVISISFGYLLKMAHLHGALFVSRDENSDEIKILKTTGIPKKFMADINRNQTTSEYLAFLFPEKISIQEIASAPPDAFIKNNFLSFTTYVVMPIIDFPHIKISLFLVSKREFINYSYLNIIIHNLRTQLRSSFTRVLNLGLISKKWEEEEIQLKTRMTTIEKANIDLMLQLKSSRNDLNNTQAELRFYKGILNEQKDILVRTNMEGQILYQNIAFDNLKPKTTECDLNNICNYLGEGDFPGLSQIINDFERGAKQVSCEIKMQLLDEQLWFNVYFIPIKNIRDIIFEIQIVARNIHPIKNLENQLKNQNEILLNIMNINHSIGFVIDTSGIILTITDSWTTYLGYQKEDCLKQSIFDYLSKEQQRIFEKAVINHSISNHQTVLSLNFISKSNRMKPFEVRLYNSSLPNQSSAIIIGSLNPL